MNRYDVKVVDDNVESILRDAIAQYEKRTGKSYNRHTLNVYLSTYMHCVRA